MFCSHLNATLKEGVADISGWDKNIAVASYDKTIRIYNDSNHLKTSYLPTIANKICICGEWLVAVSLAGEGFILNKDLNIVSTFVAIEGVSGLAFYSDDLVISSWSRGVALYKFITNETGCPSLRLEWIKTSKYRATTLVVACDRIAVGLENLLVLMDFTGKELLRKRVSHSVTALVFTECGIFIGMISGKIQFEHFTKKDESFVFNAHYEIKEDEKIFYPVTLLHYDGFLYSSGFDGRISKWDVKSKRSLGSLCRLEFKLESFLIKDEYTYIVASEMIKNMTNSLLFSRIK